MSPRMNSGARRRCQGRGVRNDPGGVDGEDLPEIDSARETGRLLLLGRSVAGMTPCANVTSAVGICYAVLRRQVFLLEISNDHPQAVASDHDRCRPGCAVGLRAECRRQQGSGELQVGCRKADTGKPDPARPMPRRTRSRIRRPRLPRRTPTPRPRKSSPTSPRKTTAAKGRPYTAERPASRGVLLFVGAQVPERRERSRQSAPHNQDSTAVKLAPAAVNL